MIDEESISSVMSSKGSIVQLSDSGEGDKGYLEDPIQVHDLCSKMCSLKVKSGVGRPRKFKKNVKCFEFPNKRKKLPGDKKKKKYGKLNPESPRIPSSHITKKILAGNSSSDQPLKDPRKAMALDLLQTAESMGIPLLKDKESSLNLILSRLSST